MHLPVLYQEIIHVLQPQSNGLYVDATLGFGGHAIGILEGSSPDGRLLGLDIDPDAIAFARERLSEYGERVIIKKSSYTTLKEQLDLFGWKNVDGILLDLGVSSLHLDSPQRGFSFRYDAPLDMRFDPTNIEQLTAADLINTLSEDKLADILYSFGDERHSRRIARAIVKARPIITTGQLAKVVASVSPGRWTIHPATRTFQALRIAVNNELESIKTVLPIAVELLTSNGRFAVIAYHSLEDRIVKEFFHRESQDCVCPDYQPFCTCDHRATIRKITRKPLRPTEIEKLKNPRARSARLRVVEKL